jgi:hypothetical protein
MTFESSYIKIDYIFDFSLYDQKEQYSVVIFDLFISVTII